MNIDISIGTTNTTDSHRTLISSRTNRRGTKKTAEKLDKNQVPEHNKTVNL